MAAFRIRFPFLVWRLSNEDHDTANCLEVQGSYNQTMAVATTHVQAPPSIVAMLGLGCKYRYGLVRTTLDLQVLIRRTCTWGPKVLFVYLVTVLIDYSSGKSYLRNLGIPMPLLKEPISG